jgi:hypothetical protein
MSSVLVIGGIVSSVNHALSFAAVVTAALTGTARYAAVLAGADRHRLERATAYGFFLGTPVTIFLFALDRIGLG